MTAASPQRPSPFPANEGGRRDLLARFGVQGMADAAAAEPAALWEALKTDFPGLGGAAGDLRTLPAELRGKILAYATQVAELDRRLAACDAAHLTILDLGPSPVRVEIYAGARDLYEAAVDDFGALRAALQAALT